MDQSATLLDNPTKLASDIVEAFILWYAIG